MAELRNITRGLTATSERHQRAHEEAREPAGRVGLVGDPDAAVGDPRVGHAGGRDRVRRAQILGPDDPAQADIFIALEKLGSLKAKIEIVVAGGDNSDRRIFEEVLNQRYVKGAYMIPENISFSTLTGPDMREISERFYRYDLDPGTPEGRIELIKRLNQGTLGDDEYLAIGLSGFPDEASAEDFRSSMAGSREETAGNVSIRLLVEPGEDASFSMSRFVDDWLRDIDSGTPRNIGITLPVPVNLVRMITEELENAHLVLRAL